MKKVFEQPTVVLELLQTEAILTDSVSAAGWNWGDPDAE